MPFAGLIVSENTVVVPPLIVPTYPLAVAVIVTGCPFELSVPPAIEPLDEYVFEGVTAPAPSFPKSILSVPETVMSLVSRLLSSIFSIPALTVGVANSGSPSTIFTMIAVGAASPS